MRKTAPALSLLIILFISPVFAEDTLSHILQEIKNRYGGAPGLFVPYTREVITRSMSMLGTSGGGDLASGIIYFKSPHFLRLDQEKPAPEKLIANGNTLWWYVPKKQEAHRYQAKDFGKELRLLSDIFRGLSDVKDSFKVSLGGKTEKGDYELVMVPDPPWREIDRIALTVSPDYDIRTVRIFNALGSVTKFNLGDFSLKKTFEKGFFEFTAPPGVTVIEESQ